MSPEQVPQIVFGPFRLDLKANQLWNGKRAVALQPKPLAVLQYLAERPGQVVTKQELLKAVWAGTVVTKAVVKECIRGIRNALGETAEAPQYLHTVGREGYRFLREVGRKQLSVVSEERSGDQPLTTPFVGREADLAHLHQLLDKALRGEPQFVFITGEPGIGKTAVVDWFREQVRARGNITIGDGQCVEQYGQGEAYLPVLEALGRLCREAGSEQLVALLRQYAPTWVVQLPGVVKEGELQALQLQVQGATQQRMLREIAEAIEVGTGRRPLMLVLEDLHWSDQATLEFLAYLGKRRQRMRFLVVATYRPIDVIMSGHPLKTVKQELQVHGQCEELRLELLSKQQVQTYMAARFGASPQLAELAGQIHRRTEGNALFMVNVIEDLLTQGYISQEQGQWTLTDEVQAFETPGNLQQLIGRQLERLSEEAQRVLEVASVVGTEFAVAAVAAAVKQEMDEVETVCEEIAGQGHFLEEQGIAEWPDGTISGRYAFRHALYQNVLYDRIAEARRIRLHRLIGERLEAGYGETARGVAAELALHFELGREPRSAVQYRQFAGENAAAKNAFHEAVAHLTKGLALLKTLPDTPENQQQELFLLATLGPSLTATKGLAAEEAAQAYRRAGDLCQQLGDTPQLFPMLWGLGTFYMARGEMATAVALSQRLLNLAESAQDTALLLQAYMANGLFFFHVGNHLQSREYLERTIALYDPRRHHTLALHFGYDPGVASLSYLAILLCFLGYPTLALQRNEQGLRLAREVSHAHSSAYALMAATWVHICRGDPQAAQAQAEEAIIFTTKQSFPYWLTQGNILWGWAAAHKEQEEGMARMQQNLAQWRAMGTEGMKPAFLGLMADVSWRRGQREEGLVLVDEALRVAERTGESFYEPELHRLKGELLLLSESKRFRLKVAAEAEGSFLKAIETACQQSAKSLELRATTSLARLWQGQGKQEEARQILAEVYDWFTEGFETKSLREAKALIEELSR